MENINKCRGALVVAVLLKMLLAGRCAAAAPEPSSSLQLADWMSHIPGTRKVSELSIPGSHDTCALYEPFPGTARCQGLSLQEQLEAGVRFLDIRCRHVHDTFKIYHGSADQKASFDDVLSTCFAFLKNHPAECVLFSVQEEYKPDGNTRSFEQTFDTYTKTNAEMWFLKDRFPTLNEARGKVVLFRRFSASAIPKGIAASEWHDNTNFWIGNAIRVQDNYVVKDKQAKWTGAESLFQEASTGNRDVLYVNFTSGYEPQLLGIPDIKVISDYMNPKLSSYLQNARLKRCGIVVMDFVDPPKCALIVRANREQSTP